LYVIGYPNRLTQLQSKTAFLGDLMCLATRKHTYVLKLKVADISARFLRKFESSRQILGAFAKLPKATISFVTSVYLSACPHGTIRRPLHKFS
jgi:hypothetical protein